jgi:hypothetical protein
MVIELMPDGGVAAAAVSVSIFPPAPASWRATGMRLRQKFATRKQWGGGRPVPGGLTAMEGSIGRQEAAGVHASESPSQGRDLVLDRSAGPAAKTVHGDGRADGLIGMVAAASATMAATATRKKVATRAAAAAAAPPLPPQAGWTRRCRRLVDWVQATTNQPRERQRRQRRHLWRRMRHHAWPAITAKYRPIWSTVD